MSSVARELYRSKWPLTEVEYKGIPEENIKGLLDEVIFKDEIPGIDEPWLRVIYPDETMTIGKDTCRAFAFHLYNKGTLVTDYEAPSDFGSGITVPRSGVAAVRGILYNDGLIKNNGQIKYI